MGSGGVIGSGFDGIGFGADEEAGFGWLQEGFLSVSREEDFDAALRWGGSMTTPSGLTGRRSSSTAAEVLFCCHSSMAPSRVGVARSCSTGSGAVPAAAKASGERPADRP